MTAQALPSGFDAMGRPVPYFRKQAAYDLMRSWNVDQQLADAVSSGMALQLERDKPHEAMEISLTAFAHDLTVAYRLMAVLLAGEQS